MKKLKKWNWPMCLLIICICIIGLLSNKNFIEYDVYKVIIAGITIGIPIGLFSAWFFK